MSNANSVILAVDDHPHNLQFLGKLLESNGYEVVLATSGKQALDYLSESTPDLILMDIMMPEMDGITVCRQLKKNPLFNLTPVIFLTAKTESEDIVRGFQAGAADYLTKPFHVEELLIRVKTHIELKRSRIKQIQLKEKVEVHKNRLEHIIEGTNAGTWEWNIETEETIFNERWANIAGYTLKELDLKKIDDWMDLIHPDDLPVFQEKLQLHFNGESDYYEFESRIKHKNGQWIWVMDRGKVIDWNSEGKPLSMFGIHMDIDERKHYEKKLQEIATKDPLTNIFNRRHLFERLQALVDKYNRDKNIFSLAILDIDHFKRINDTYGHPAGDFILKEFARILGENIRPYDLLGRYGGEEFILVFIDMDKKSSSVTVQRILDFIREQKFQFEGKDIQYTFSCGISDLSEFDNGQGTIKDLISHADQRLYQAKESGRNQIITGTSYHCWDI